MVTKTIKYKDYQELIKEKKIKVINHSDFIDNLFNLDNKVNDIITSKSDVKDYKYTNWSITKLEIDNFLSYGDGNVINFTNLEGITGIFANNQEGKTTAILDTLLFLLFNKTTKTTKSEEILNIYRNKDSCKVKGYFIIDNNNYIIEREVIRKWKKDRSGFTCKTELNFYKELDDGTIEDLNGTQRQETDKIIRENIGNINDFIMTILTTGDNLTNIIDAKPTERGQLLTRFLGLEIFEEKESVCKEIFFDWKQKLKSNIYDLPTLKVEIDEINEEILEHLKNKEETEETLLKVSDNVKLLKDTKDTLLSSLSDIDDSLVKLDIKLIKSKYDKTGEDIKNKKKEIKLIKGQISKIVTKYNKDKHDKLILEQRDKSTVMSRLSYEFKTKENSIKKLEKGDKCPTCGQSLKDHDHTKEIEELQKRVEELELILEKDNESILVINNQLLDYEKTKEDSDLKDKLELNRDKTEIEIEGLLLREETQKRQVDDYNTNIDKINKNTEINEKIREMGFKLYQEETEEKELISKVKDIDNIITNSNKEIEERDKLIEIMEKEQEIQKIFVSYLSLVGKSGLSKSIIRDYIPLINNELSKLLLDCTNFIVELDMNMKNQELILNIRDIKTQKLKPLISGSGYEKTLSSLALRIVLNKINCLPKPNFILFDEVLEKVSEENMEKIPSFFEKIRNYFDIVFLISHDTKLKDWTDNVLTVNKSNNVSSIGLT